MRYNIRIRHRIPKDRLHHGTRKREPHADAGGEQDARQAQIPHRARRAHTDRRRLPAQDLIPQDIRQIPAPDRQIAEEQPQEDGEEQYAPQNAEQGRHRHPPRKVQQFSHH